MANFAFSIHALEQMENRNISQEIVKEVLAFPDKIENEFEHQIVYQKTINFIDGNFLVRVFVNAEKEPNLVKTIYRTSKFEKYQ